MIAIFPEIATASVAKQFDELGQLVRQYFAGERARSPQLPMADVVSSAGISCRAAVGPNAGLGAIVARDQAGRVDVSILLATTSMPPVEESFMLAHLLGHWLLHIQPAIARGEWKTSGYSEEDLPSHYFDGYVFGADTLSAADRLESEANLFAASLLLPKAMVEKAFTKLTDPARMAAFFQVPMTVLQARLIQLGLIKSALDFSAAERRLKSPPKETLGGRELVQALASKMTSDQPKSSVPRSFAASSYGTMQRQTKPESSQPAQPQVKVAEKSDTKAEPRSKPGLDRLRDIARRMDPSVK